MTSQYLNAITFKMGQIARWARAAAPNVSLDTTGLIALADLSVLAKRTARTGSSCYLDTFVLAPGIHRQQEADNLHGGENPITANMTSGYVFRVENPATVSFLQSKGTTGALTTLEVDIDMRGIPWLQPYLDLSGPLLAVIFYLIPLALTLFTFSFFIAIEDHWGLGVLLALALARFLNVVVIRRRLDANWHGVSEEGVTGELLVLLSQDRWIRIVGLVDHLKRVTSGEWLRYETFFENLLGGIATVLVYLCAAFASNATQVGKICILILFLVNAGLIAFSNESMDSLHMKGCVLKQVGQPKFYKRRLDMAHELIEKSGRSDWAIKMGMINEPAGKDSNKTSESIPKMVNV